MKEFPIELLRTFVATVDGGSMAKAARVVERTPSAVSLQIPPGMRTHTALDRTTAIPVAAPTPPTRSVGAWMARLLTPWWRRGAAAPLTLVLRKSATASVTVRRAPLTVRCVEGSVWVTHDADPGDHVLRPGERFVASGPGRLVMLALDPSRAIVSDGGEAIAVVDKEEPP